MKYLVILILLTAVAFGQGLVRTTPVVHEGVFVFADEDPAQPGRKINDYDVLGKYGDGVDTSAAFYLRGWRGAATLWLAGDTTDVDDAVLRANDSDSCLVVGFQLKDPDFGWGGLYSETTVNYTVLDTISRALINAAGDIFVYLPLAEEIAWAPSDSGRFIFWIGVGDTLPFKAKLANGNQ